MAILHPFFVNINVRRGIKDRLTFLGDDFAEVEDVGPPDSINVSKAPDGH